MCTRLRALMHARSSPQTTERMCIHTCFACAHTNLCSPACSNSHARTHARARAQGGGLLWLAGRVVIHQWYKGKGGKVLNTMQGNVTVSTTKRSASLRVCLT